MWLNDWKGKGIKFKKKPYKTKETTHFVYCYNYWSNSITWTLSYRDDELIQWRDVRRPSRLHRDVRERCKGVDGANKYQLQGYATIVRDMYWCLRVECLFITDLFILFTCWHSLVLILSSGFPFVFGPFRHNSYYLGFSG